MKKHLLKHLFGVFVILIYSAGSAQIKPLNLIKADSLASGNYKDVLTSFFKLGFNDLTGSNKNLSFTSNPFAIIAKTKPSLLVDTNYIKNTALRRLNIAFTLQLDSSNRFNGFGSGITYALVDRRDVTISKEFLQSVSNLDIAITRLNDERLQYAAQINDNSLQNKFIAEVNSLFTDPSYSFNKLDPFVKKLVEDFAEKYNATYYIKLMQADTTVNFRTLSQKNYTSVYNNYQNKHLLTVGVADTTYSDGFFFKNLVFNAESVRGILNPNNAVNMQWDIKVFDLLNRDSTKPDRNLKRQLFSIEPGLNLVIKNKSTQKSWLEFKLSSQYNHIFNGIYNSENKDSTTLNGTLRLRILDDLWVPLEIKYDPKNGNVFGFLNVRFNFTSLNKKQQSLPQP